MQNRIESKCMYQAVLGAIGILVEMILSDSESIAVRAARSVSPSDGLIWKGVEMHRFLTRAVK